MTPILQALSNIEKSFPGRPYSDPQKEIFFEMVERYGEAAFITVCKNFIAEGSRRPLPVDFKTSLKGFRRIDGRKEVPKDEINCWHCYETGYSIVEHGNISFLAVCCTCTEGIFAQIRERGAIPKIETSMTRLSFPVVEFTPKPGEMQEKIEWWNEILEFSRSTWKRLKCPESAQEPLF